MKRPSVRRVAPRVAAAVLVAVSSLGLVACNGKAAGDGHVDPPSSAPKR